VILLKSNCNYWIQK